MKKLFLCVLIVISLLIQGLAFAEDSLKDSIAKKYAANNNNLDPVIKEFLSKGTDPRLLVSTCVQLGYEVCYVVNTSLAAGADRQLVIFGALDGGATSENLNRCEGLGYSFDPPSNIANPPATPPTISNSKPTPTPTTTTTTPPPSQTPPTQIPD